MVLSEEASRRALTMSLFIKRLAYDNGFVRPFENECTAQSAIWSHRVLLYLNDGLFLHPSHV
jgi:hypothetical protein